MPLCILGGLGLFLPWRGSGPFSFLYRLGWDTWHGGFIGLLLLLTFLHLVSTDPLDPKPAWRSLITALLATTALVLFNVYAYGHGADWPRNVGGWVTLAGVVGLLVCASLELRGVFRQRQEPQPRR